MSNVNWSDENSLGEILRGLLMGVSSIDYAYDENVENNPLEIALYNMLNRISTKRPNLVSVITLDNYGITGDNLVKLWKMCNEDSEYFEKMVSYISGTSLSKCFTRNEVISNMELDDPIPFIPDDDLVPFFGELVISGGKIDIDKVDEIIFALRLSLVEKYNKKVKDEGLDVERLPLPIKEEEKKLDGSIRVNPARLYFGKVTRDLTGGVLGINMETYGLFESSPNVMKIGGKLYYTLRDLEDGSFVMTDESGQKIDWDTPVLIDGEEKLPSEIAMTSLLPSKEIVKLSVGPVKYIIKDAIEHSIDSECIEKYKMMLKSGTTVSECNAMLKDLTSIYAALYGGIGKNKEM